MLAFLLFKWHWILSNDRRILLSAISQYKELPLVPLVPLSGHATRHYCGDLQTPLSWAGRAEASESESEKKTGTRHAKIST